MTKKKEQKLVFKIEAEIEIGVENLYGLDDVKDVMETLQGIGTAKIVSVEVKGD